MCPPSDAGVDNGRAASSVPAVVPSDPISQAAHAHAVAELHHSILAHSIRVYLHAAQISRQEGLAWHTDARLSFLLFVACIFHDMGTSSTYDTGPTRFEIEGADAAVKFLSQYPSVTEAERQEVWTAIAIHTSPQIAERIGVLPRLVRMGVLIDFKRPAVLSLVSDEWRQQTDIDFPRANIEKVLGDAVVEQALKRPDKAPAACWPGIMYKAKLAEPEWDGVNKAF